MGASLWAYIRNRLGEASTWKAILSFAVGAGLKLNDVQIELISAAMISVYAALTAFLPDPKK